LVQGDFYKGDSTVIATVAGVSARAVEKTPMEGKSKRGEETTEGLRSM